MNFDRLKVKASVDDQGNGAFPSNSNIISHDGIPLKDILDEYDVHNHDDRYYQMDKDISTIGKVSADGGFYKGEDYLHPMKKIDGYWGFPEITDYLRVPPEGILPNQDVDGQCQIGMDTMPFNYGFFNNLFKNGISIPNNDEAPEILTDETKLGCVAFKFPSGLLITKDYASIYGSPTVYQGMYTINIPVPPKHIVPFVSKVFEMGYATSDKRTVVGAQISRNNKESLEGVNNAMYVYEILGVQSGFYGAYITMGRWK